MATYRYLLISITCFILWGINSYAQITSYRIEKPVEVKAKQIITPYDSLENITRQNISSLVGQQVQVLPLGSRLGITPTLFKSKPKEVYSSSTEVVEPGDKSYESRKGAFDNQIFDIIGVDSLSDKTDYSSIITTKFYLIVKNDKYPTAHYLEVGGVMDSYYSPKGKLRELGQLNRVDRNFIILGYYEKYREKLKTEGRKYVNKNEDNKVSIFQYVVYNLADGSPLKSVPKNHIWTVEDYIYMESTEYTGFCYILTSDSIKNVFVRADVFENDLYSPFIEYEKFIAAENEKTEWKQRMIRTYGKTNGTLIIQHKVKIGFSKKMCEESWGIPNSINKSTGSWGVHEQWVYSGGYLYFENGKLTAIDN